MQYRGFTRQARKVMRIAERLAEKEQQLRMGSEYILAGLLQENDGVAGQILQQLSVNCEEILTLIHEISLPKTGGTGGRRGFPDTGEPRHCGRSLCSCRAV